MKFINLFISILLIFHVMACSASRDRTPVLENESYDQEHADYQIITGTYLEDAISIQYPQMQNMSDHEKQKDINDIILKEAMKVLNYYSGVERELDLDIDYHVTLVRPELLSIVYSGEGYVQGAAHPNRLFYTTNIDLRGEPQKIVLRDVIEINQGLVNDIKSELFYAVIPEQKEVLEIFSDEQLEDKLRNADRIESVGSDRQSDTYSYYTENALGISFGVGHGGGGHAEFEGLYSHVIDRFKEDSLLKNVLIE